jgi:acetyl esterase
MSSFQLDQPARELTEALSKAPSLTELPLAAARKAVEAAQSAPVPMPDIDESWITVPSDFGDVRVRLVRPQGVKGSLPVVLYLHGGGWVIGSWVTHDLLCRRLSEGAKAVVAFVEYSLAPEAKYPVQIEQSYAVAQWIRERGEVDGFDPTRVAVAGDSAGGNMATVLTIMARQRDGLQLVHQSLYYPMTDANAEESESLRLFKDGPYGSADGSSGSGAATSPTRDCAARSPSPRCRQRWPISRVCHPLWSLWIRTTCSGTKVRRTPTSFVMLVFSPHRCASTARSTTS